MPRRKSPRTRKRKGSKGRASPSPQQRVAQESEEAVITPNTPVSAQRVRNHYALLFLPKEDRELLIRLGKACIDQCQSLDRAWRMINTERTGVVSLTQFSMGLGQVGVQKSAIKAGEEPLDPTKCFNVLNLDGSNSAPTLSQKEFSSISLLLYDENIRMQLKGIEKVGDVQQMVPTERVLVELWLHILPLRSVNSDRRVPMEHDAVTAVQLLKVLLSASMTEPLIKAEIGQIASGGVLVLREVLMTFSRSSGVVQEVITVAFTWASIPGLRPSLFKQLHLPLAYTASHPLDGVLNWDWIHLAALHDCLIRIQGEEVKRSGSKDRADPEPGKRMTRAAMAKAKRPQDYLYEVQLIAEMSEAFNNAETQWVVSQNVDGLVMKLRMHNKLIQEAVTQAVGQNPGSTATQKMRTAFVEYPTPFSADFIFADAPLGPLLGAYIKATSFGGICEEAGVLAGWRLLSIRRGRQADPSTVTDAASAQKLLERWGMSKVQLVLTFEGPAGIESLGDAKSHPSSQLDRKGVAMVREAILPSITYGGVRVMNKLVRACNSSGHWAAGVESLKDLVELAEDIEKYYVVVVEQFPPNRSEFVSMTSGGVCAELHSINAQAQMYLMLKEGKGKAKVDTKQNTTGDAGPVWRPLSAGAYRRIRRPLSGTSPYNDKFSGVVCRPPSPEQQKRLSRPQTAVSEPARSPIRIPGANSAKQVKQAVGAAQPSASSASNAGGSPARQVHFSPAVAGAANKWDVPNAAQSPLFVKTAWAKRSLGVEALRNKLATSIFVSPDSPQSRSLGNRASIHAKLSRTW